MPSFREKIRVMSQMERPQKGVTHIRRGTNLSYIIQGVVAIPLPLTALIALLLLSVLVGFFMLIKLDYTHVEKVQGFLTPTTRVVKVAAPSGWIVKELNVTLDQEVQKGDRLFTLTRDTTADNGGGLAANIKDNVDRQRNEIEQQRQAGLEQYRSAIENTDKVIREHEGAHTILESKLSHLKSLTEQVKDRRDEIKTLFDERIVSKEQYNQAQLQYEQLVSQQKDLQLQLAENDKAITQLRATKEDAKGKLDQGMAQLNIQKEQLSARELETKQNTEISIDAPADGMISKLDINQGSTITNKVDVIEIMPSKSLWAELYVPTSKGAFIKCNQSAKMVFAAYPVEKFGTFTGHLVYIPPSAYTAPELGMQAQNAETAMYYKVYADVDDIKRFNQGKIFSREGKLINFKPGMTLEADIKMENKSLLEWLFPPIFHMKERLFGNGRHKEDKTVAKPKPKTEPSWFERTFPNIHNFFFGGDHYTGETNEDWSCHRDPYQTTTTDPNQASGSIVTTATTPEGDAPAASASTSSTSTVTESSSPAVVTNDAGTLASTPAAVTNNVPSSSSTSENVASSASPSTPVVEVIETAKISTTTKATSGSASGSITQAPASTPTNVDVLDKIGTISDQSPEQKGKDAGTKKKTQQDGNTSKNNASKKPAAVKVEKIEVPNASSDPFASAK